MSIQTKKQIRRDERNKLIRENEELKAQLVHKYHFASKELDKLGTDSMMASAVILSLKSLGGLKTCGPVAIRNGLSKETIEAIKADLKRSYEEAIEFKP